MSKPPPAGAWPLPSERAPGSREQVERADSSAFREAEVARAVPVHLPARAIVMQVSVPETASG